MYGNGCPCQRTDYGFDMPDLRSRILIDLETFSWDSCEDRDETCEGPECCAESCGVESIEHWIEIRVRRVWDVECDCGGTMFRTVYDVTGLSESVLTFDKYDDAEGAVYGVRAMRKRGWTPAKIAAVERHERDERDFQSMCDSERRMGC